MDSESAYRDLRHLVHADDAILIKIRKLGGAVDETLAPIKSGVEAVDHAADQLRLKLAGVHREITIHCDPDIIHFK